MDNNENLNNVETLDKEEFIDKTEIILNTLKQNEILLNNINAQFESKLKYDSHKEKIIDKLHEELQKHKEDLYKQMLKPLVLDLIFFIEQNQKRNVFLKIKEIDENIEDLKDILEKQGVNSFKLTSDVFDPLKQKIVKTVETDKIELDKKICEHLYYGYEWENKLLKQEGVSVYVYKKNEN